MILRPRQDPHRKRWSFCCLGSPIFRAFLSDVRLEIPKVVGSSEWDACFQFLFQSSGFSGMQPSEPAAPELPSNTKYVAGIRNLDPVTLRKGNVAQLCIPVTFGDTRNWHTRPKVFLVVFKRLPNKLTWFFKVNAAQQKQPGVLSALTLSLFPGLCFRVLYPQLVHCC